MRKLVTVVFTIERNLHFGHQCIQHLRKNGFTDPILKVYPAAPKGSSNWKLHKSIMTNHYNVLQWFAQTYDANTHDVMVCEDDCEFVQKNVAKFVDQKLNILHSNNDWSVCVLGQIPYMPIFMTGHNQLIRTLWPATSHCYIFNGTKLKDYLNRINRYWWQSPFMIEGWLLIPPWEKFGMFPSIATQNRQIKSIARLPYLRDVPVIKFIRFFEYVMHSMPFVILLVLVLVCVWRLWKYYRSYNQST